MSIIRKMDIILLATSIGCIVFLIQQTDFIYEYLNLAISITRLNFIKKNLKMIEYENSINFENYIMFIGSVYGVSKNLLGFAARLTTCFICLSCFVSFFSVLFIKKSILMIFPCFFISLLVYYILFLIKKSIFN